MKKLIYLIVLLLMVCTLFLSGCKRSIEELPATESTSSEFDLE